jgi:hypothetical protein
MLRIFTQDCSSPPKLRTRNLHKHIFQCPNSHDPFRNNFFAKFGSQKYRIIHFFHLDMVILSLHPEMPEPEQVDKTLYA